VVDAVYPPVNMAAFDGVGVIVPPTLDVHQVKPARTERVLMDHVEREIALVAHGGDE